MADTKREFIELPHGDSYIERLVQIPEKIRVDDDQFYRIWNLHPEEKGEVMMFGKKVKTPRWQQSYGEAYDFSGMKHSALPLPGGYLTCLLGWVREDSGEKYNQILVNWYSDGSHYIGKHADDESQLVKDSAIYSFAYEEKINTAEHPKYRPREFVVESYSPLKNIPKYRRVFPMPNNSLLIMGGEMQKHYKHSVPKRALSTSPGKRINITFRLFKK